MSDQPTELMRYELDVSDVELKLARLNQLLEQVKAKRAAGENTSELEVQIGRETDALGKLGAKEAEAAGGAAELVKHKRELAAAVNLVGGRFGPMIGQLSSVVSLFTTATPVVAAFGAALAGFAAGAAYMRQVAEAAERAAAAQQKLNDAVLAGQLMKLGRMEGLAAGLEPFAARSPENIQAGVELIQRLRESWGVREETAQGVAPVAVAGGLGVEEAAMLSVLAGAGVKPQTPQEAQALLGDYRERGQYAQLLAQAESQRRDPAGQAERTRAMAPTAGGTGMLSPEQAAYEALKAGPGGLEAAGFPADVSWPEFRMMLSTGRATRDMELALAREMYPGRRKLTHGLHFDEYSRVQALAATPIGAAKHLADQIGELQAGGGPENLGPLFHTPGGTDAALRELIEVGRAQLRALEELARKEAGNTFIGTQQNTGDRRRRMGGAVRLQSSTTDHKNPRPG